MRISELADEGISYRAWQKLESRQAAAVAEAHYTARDSRTPRQERVLYDAGRLTAKIMNRDRNVSEAGRGVRIPVTNGRRRVALGGGRVR